MYLSPYHCQEKSAGFKSLHQYRAYQIQNALCQAIIFGSGPTIGTISYMLGNKNPFQVGVLGHLVSSGTLLILTASGVIERLALRYYERRDRTLIENYPERLSQFIEHERFDYYLKNLGNRKMYESSSVQKEGLALQSEISLTQDIQYGTRVPSDLEIALIFDTIPTLVLQSDLSGIRKLLLRLPGRGPLEIGLFSSSTGESLRDYGCYSLAETLVEHHISPVPFARDRLFTYYGACRLLNLYLRNELQASYNQFYDLYF